MCKERTYSFECVLCEWVSVYVCSVNDFPSIYFAVYVPLSLFFPSYSHSHSPNKCLQRMLYSCVIFMLKTKLNSLPLHCSLVEEQLTRIICSVHCNCYNEHVRTYAHTHTDTQKHSNRAREWNGNVQIERMRQKKKILGYVCLRRLPNSPTIKHATLVVSFAFKTFFSESHFHFVPFSLLFFTHS